MPSDVIRQFDKDVKRINEQYNIHELQAGCYLCNWNGSCCMGCKYNRSCEMIERRDKENEKVHNQ